MPNAPISITSLVAKLKNGLSIDAKHVHAVGFSNGGMMMHRLAAELPNVLASVAAVAGTVGGKVDENSAMQTINPSTPISMMLVHGMDDIKVTFGGGLNKGGLRRYDIAFADSVALWVKTNACNTIPVIKKLTTTKGTTTVRTFNGCTNETEVVGVAVGGLGHTFPTKTNTGGFDGPAAILKFFQTHPLP